MVHAQAVIIIGTYDADGTPNAMNWRSSERKAKLAWALPSRNGRRRSHAAWAGQWDGDKIMILMGNHLTTVWRRCTCWHSIPSILAILRSASGWVMLSRMEHNWNNVRRKSGIKVYFADLHALWQKVASKITKGLLSPMIQRKINARPRKKLNFLTPEFAL